jgi:hypothetical protein
MELVRGGSNRDGSVRIGWILARRGLALASGTRVTSNCRTFLIVAILWILPVLRPITCGERCRLDAESGSKGLAGQLGVARCTVRRMRSLPDAKFAGYKDGDMIQSYLRWLSVVAVALVGASGCCVNRFGEPVPQGTGFTSGLQFLSGQRCSSCGPTTFAEKSVCRTGCGEIYWDEWLSDPPDCCDPCDDCGNWVGPQACCRKRPMGGLWSMLWGCRGESCAEGECCDDGCVGGCQHCGEAACGVEPPSCIDRAIAHAPPETLDTRPPTNAKPMRPIPPAPTRSLPNDESTMPPMSPAPSGARSPKAAPAVKAARPPQKRTAKAPSRVPARPAGHVE